MDKENETVIRLASLVSDADQSRIPILLLQMDSLLQRHSKSSKEHRDLKEDFLKYDLLSWCSLALKYDYSTIKDGYKIAVKLVSVLYQSSIGLNVGKTHEFFTVTLPEAIQRALVIAWYIQREIVEKQKDAISFKLVTVSNKLNDLKSLYQTLLDTLTHICTSHPDYVGFLLNSDNLLRLIIVDDEFELTTATLSLILHVIRVNQFIIKELSPSLVNLLLDELVYKLTTTENTDIALLSTKIIVEIIEAKYEIINMLSIRFKGLNALLLKWMGEGFNHSLKKLTEFLEAGKADVAETARKRNAVRTIWAAYQGWKTRTRVKKLHSIIPSLQISFREKRQERLDRELYGRLIYERENQQELTRKRSMRSTREKQLNMMEIVPASKVVEHIQNEEENAATKIQKLSRGWMQRRKYHQQLELARLSRAAVVIQRATRKFSSKREKIKEHRKEPVELHKLLTIEQKAVYQLAIREWQLIHDFREVPLQKTKEIHDRAQGALAYYCREKFVSSHESKSEALLAKFNTEIEHLQNLPRLQDVTLEDVNQMSSRSTTVVMAAEKEHKRVMKELTSPWWQKLLIKDDENLNMTVRKGKVFPEDVEKELDQFNRDDDDLLF